METAFESFGKTAEKTIGLAATGSKEFDALGWKPVRIQARTPFFGNRYRRLDPDPNPLSQQCLRNCTHRGFTMSLQKDIHACLRRFFIGNPDRTAWPRQTVSKR